jgi:fumarate reductase subunit D
MTTVIHLHAQVTAAIMTKMKILVFRIVMPVGQMVLVELGAPINAVATSTVRRIVTLAGLMVLAVPGALTFAIRN